MSDFEHKGTAMDRIKEIADMMVRYPVGWIVFGVFVVWLVLFDGRAYKKQKGRFE